MKEIQSAGGPLIGLPCDQMQSWAGVFGKRFIGEKSPFRTDYEATVNSDGGRDRSRRNISKIIGSNYSGILINPPNYTAVIHLDGASVYIVQVCYSDPEWDFSLISQKFFEEANFKSIDDIIFSCKSCTYALFDAAYDGCNVGDDCLNFDLDEGDYIFSTAIYKPDARTELILCRITRKVDAVSSAPPFQRL